MERETHHANLEMRRLSPWLNTLECWLQYSRNWLELENHQTVDREVSDTFIGELMKLYMRSSAL